MNMKMKRKDQRKERRHRRVRAKIFGTKNRPRLSVFRSLKHIYAQIINDEVGNTLVAASDLEFRKSKPLVKSKKIKEEKGMKAGKIAVAYQVGKLIAEKALKKKIKKVVFDRGGFKYHGRIKALADGARDGGLVF
ncbi:MAG: 50S ribosomal protein L18 [Patescibacteria group bacterium]|nr:50S ribosomal protein L18 [Patescibacteria group bacterium]